MTYIFLILHVHVIEFLLHVISFLKQHTYVGGTFHTCYTIKKSHNIHMFLFFVCSTPGIMSTHDTICNFLVSQWDHTSSMVGCHNYVSTASSQRNCVSQLTLHDNLANRCGWRSSSHSSPLSETRHVSDNSLLKNISY